jgi:hypothetical protein
VRLLALWPLLAYCASLGWWWRWSWRSRWNVDWQGKPKFSEKICPSATFVHHKIPHDQTRVWTRATMVGSRRLTAWAIARPSISLCNNTSFSSCLTDVTVHFFGGGSWPVLLIGLLQAWFYSVQSRGLTYRVLWAGRTHGRIWQHVLDKVKSVVSVWQIFLSQDDRTKLLKIVRLKEWKNRFWGGGVKLTTHLHLVPRSRMMEIYLHSPLCLHGVVLN